MLIIAPRGRSVNPGPLAWGFQIRKRLRIWCASNWQAIADFPLSKAGKGKIKGKTHRKSKEKTL